MSAVSHFLYFFFEGFFFFSSYCNIHIIFSSKCEKWRKRTAILNLFIFPFYLFFLLLFFFFFLYNIMWNNFFVGNRKTVRFTVFCCCCCFDKRDLIYNISGGKINQYNQLWLVILLLSFFFFCFIILEL